MTRLRCPNHTPCPTGYLAWHEWALRKSRAYRQVKCQQCGEYTIWVRKEDQRRYFLIPPTSARAELHQGGR